MVSESPRLRSAAGWLVVALLVALQWGLFRSYVVREVAWAYPAYFDQVASLSRSYEIHERIRSGGLASGLSEGLALTGAAGSLLPLQAAVFHRLFGPSRSSALGVGFLYFAALQAALAATLLWLTGRWSVALMGIGLLLCAKSPHLPLGGLSDFRMDSPAASLMGVFLCLAIRSRTFADRSWSMAAGMLAALLVAMRTLTLVYLTGILGGLAAILLWRGRHGAGPSGQAWRRRMGGLVAACLALGAVALPLVTYKWQRIHDYYVVGHVTGPDRWIHARLLGLRTTFDLLLFYPLSFLRDHAGGRFLLAAAGILAACFLASRVQPRATRVGGHDWIASLTLAGLAFVVPLAVLTTDVAKSPVVAGILVVPALWLVLLATVGMAGLRPGEPAAPRVQAALRILCVAILAAGVQAQWEAFGGQGPFAARRGDVEAAKAMHGLIGESSRVMGWSSPVVTVDRLADFLVPSIVTTEMYERRGVFVKVHFGSWGLGEVTEQSALQSIARSDFVVLTTAGSSEEPFPFDASMRKLHPRLMSACQREHVALGRFRIQGIEAVPYVRAALRVEGGRDGLIPDEGIVLTGLGPVLRSRPCLELVGDVAASPASVGEVVAAVGNRGRAFAPVSATLSVSGGSYRIRLELPPDGFDPASPAEVRVQAKGGRLQVPRGVRLEARSDPGRSQDDVG